MAKGGKRKGSGNKLIYGEPTYPYTKRVPVSKLEAVEKLVCKFLKKYLV